jgi:superfamily I DNA and/or RNA helicase
MGDGKEMSKRKGADSAIVGMTALSALTNLALKTNSLAPNAVLVDEAGQLPLAQGACLGLIGAGCVILFGDDQQMPPVYSSELAGEALATSVFARLRQAHPGAVMMLRNTYRLNADLCRVVGETFYGGELEPHEAARNRRFPVCHAEDLPRDLIGKALDPRASLVWVRSPGEFRQSNPVEAEFVAEVVSRCIQLGLPTEAMAVVTPFRRQAALIRNRIGVIVGPHTRIPTIDTVERVQGLTVEMVTVSLCASDTEYVASVADFLLSPNRLNVAVSRARSKALLLASPSIFDVIPTDYAGLEAVMTWRAFLERVPLVLDLDSTS